MATNQTWQKQTDGNGQETMTLVSSKQVASPPPNGDVKLIPAFSVLGLETLMRVMVGYINGSKDEHSKPHITYEELRAEIEAKMIEITNGTP